MGCCVRRSRVVLASVADAKSAEVLASPTGRDKTFNPPMTVTKRNSLPGRARRKPLKPFACGNAGLFRWTCGDDRVPTTTHAHGLRAHWAPGIPHALFGRKFFLHNSGDPRRGNAKLRLMPSLRGASDDPSTLAAQASQGASPPKRQSAKAEAIHSFFASRWIASLRSQ